MAVSNGTVTVQVNADDYSGTASELLDQVDEVATATGGTASGVSGGRSTIETTSGLVGVSETFTRPGADGMNIAFVTDGTGIDVQVAAAPGHTHVLTAAVREMVRSIGPWEQAAAPDGEAS